MNLIISILYASVVIRFDVPAAGNYFLLSAIDPENAIVEASNHVSSPCHAADTIPNDNPHRIFWAFFVPDPVKP